MTDNTPLNADDELRRHCDSLGVPSLWYDKLIDIVEADRKRGALEARIDELKKIEIGGDNIWTVNSGTDTAMLIEERIAELKAQLEEL